MARGLSELQRTILRIAYRNHQNPPGFYTWGIWREPSDARFNPDVFPNEVLVEYYGWEIGPIRKVTVEDAEKSIHDIHCDRDYELDFSPRRDGGFSKESIGAKRYAKGRVAVMRAFDRLAERGLLASYPLVDGFGVRRERVADLTEAGIEAAKALKVDPREIVVEEES
jgi:hypothetical protein